MNSFVTGESYGSLLSRFPSVIDFPSPSLLSYMGTQIPHLLLIQLVKEWNGGSIPVKKRCVSLQLSFSYNFS